MDLRGLGCVGALALAASAGCTSLLGVHDPILDQTHDGSNGGMDARIDADVDSQMPDGSGTNPDGHVAGASPLLLSEVVLTPTDGEMIEIVNTQLASIDLSTYFLTDNGNYFKLPTGGVTVDANDFIAQFPAGTVIEGHGVITVALASATQFTTLYGVPPTFSIADGTIPLVASTGTPNLTNAGEMIALFQWDGNSDLVLDADIMLAGIPSSSNGLVNKSGLAQDGIDADNVTTAYAIDARTIKGQAGTPQTGVSTKRIALEDGHEVQAGTGNGIAGEDETSEDTSVTWDNSTTFTAPTPGQVPPELLP